MSTSIDTAFIRKYEAEFHAVFQRTGGYLRVAVRTKDNIEGKSTTFQKIGNGTATTKARHGVITPMNQDHTAIECTLADFFAGDYVDKLDEAKTNVDERLAIAQGGAWALGRKCDDQILTALDATTQTAATITLSSIPAIRNSFIAWVGKLDSADVPNDGMRFGVLSPIAHQFLMLVDQYQNADYREFIMGDMPNDSGANMYRFRYYLGVNWIVHSGVVAAGTASAKCFVWHKNAVGYATGAHSENKAQDAGNTVSADVQWIGPRYAHWVNHAMSGGACLIDDTGVIEAVFDDTTSLPTS